jgi:hypothetical protein
VSCPISIHDDLPSNSIETAFDRLDRAHRAVLRLALRLDDGASSGDFPGLNLDAHIRRTLGEMHAARYEADVALCSLMRGEAYQPRPSQPAQGVEMQARAYRNERRLRPSPDSSLPATVSPAGV